jgi:PLP dependent protein
LDPVSYAAVMSSVSEAVARSARSSSEVTVVAVSKGQPLEKVIEVYELGHRDFGENRAQELAEKAGGLPKDIRWHFIGPLQTNKARLVRSVTTLLHSMDRKSLALAWLKGSGLPPPVLVQVNLGDEPQKSGVPETEALPMVETALQLGLDVRGLMAIPPEPDHPEASRPYFRRLRLIGEMIRDRHPGVTELSMGMTDDYRVAIEEGASIIRVGRAIFGPRQ